jgi:protein arginine N-methyltransferase 1
MYTVLDYGDMALDPTRSDAYTRALARAVQPGSIVADLGSGTGLFALLAARAGAARVYAIDVNPAVWLAQDLAAENGLGDRIVVHEASSLDVTLPERVDVIVSDLRGSIPLHGDHLSVLHDAKSRFLTPHGKLLPVRDRLMVGLVESPAFWQRLSHAWVGFEDRGLSAVTARAAALNAAYSDSDGPLHANNLLTHGEPWLDLEYGEPPATSYERAVALPVRRGGVAHALAVWFEATILDDIGYDNAPGTLSVYARRVLPLAEPTPVVAGDRAEVTLRASAHGDRWAWDTTIESETGAAKATFRQSTFLGMPASPASLLRRSSAFCPELSPRGKRAARVLEMMDGSKAVAEILAALRADESTTMIDDVEAVRDLVSRYAR